MTKAELGARVAQELSEKLSENGGDINERIYKAFNDWVLGVYYESLQAEAPPPEESEEAKE